MQVVPYVPIFAKSAEIESVKDFHVAPLITLIRAAADYHLAFLHSGSTKENILTFVTNPETREP